VKVKASSLLDAIDGERERVSEELKPILCYPPLE